MEKQSEQSALITGVVDSIQTSEPDNITKNIKTTDTIANIKENYSGVFMDELKKITPKKTPNPERLEELESIRALGPIPNPFTATEGNYSNNH